MFSQKLLRYTLLCVILCSCQHDTIVKDTEPIPIQRPANYVSKEFKWYAENVDFRSMNSQLADAIGMLKYIDKQLHHLDRRAYASSGATMNHLERAEYLEVRAQIMLFIHEISLYIETKE